MKCCRRSTIWLARSAALALLAATWPVWVRADQELSPIARVRAALEASVRNRLGGDAAIVVEHVTVQWAGDPPAGEVTVVPEPAQRVGGPMRFTVQDATVSGRRRALGRAQATVRATQTYVKVVRPVSRGARIGLGDVVAMRSDVGRRPLEPLPALADVIGVLARRTLAAGEIVSGRVTKRPPLVERGDELVLRARAAGVEVTARAVASEAGALGDVIRVVNADSSRPLKAEIVGPGEVEVRHVR